MTSLVIVEAERGVTHLMLILDLDGANEANGREADEQETQQLGAANIEREGQAWW